MDKPEWLLNEIDPIYRAKAKKNLSSHQLADFRKSPILYWRKRNGLIADKDSPAYAFGRAAHTLILEGDYAFDAMYAVGGPINNKTGNLYGQKTKAYSDWLSKSGKNCAITYDDETKLRYMQASVLSHPLAPSLISDGFAEHVVRIYYLDVPCQIRLDYFSFDGGIVDLKTCDDLDWFEHDAKRYGYIHQLAFYRAIFSRAASYYPDVSIIAVEKNEPYRCGVWRVSEDALYQAQCEVDGEINRLRICTQTGDFPTGYETLRTLE